MTIQLDGELVDQLFKFVGWAFSGVGAAYLIYLLTERTKKRETRLDERTRVVTSRKEEPPSVVTLRREKKDAPTLPSTGLLYGGSYVRPNPLPKLESYDFSAQFAPPTTPKAPYPVLTGDEFKLFQWPQPASSAEGMVTPGEPIKYQIVNPTWTYAKYAKMIQQEPLPAAPSKPFQLDSELEKIVKFANDSVAKITPDRLLHVDKKDGVVIASAHDPDKWHDVEFRKTESEIVLRLRKK